jgi:hypothetical protein
VNFLSPAPTKLLLKRWSFLLLLLVAGCQKDEIKVYIAPKDISSNAQAGGNAQPAAQLGYALPDGWKESTPSGPMVIKLEVPGKSGSGEVSAMQFPARGIPTLELINVVRQDSGLPEMTEEELNHDMEPVQIGGEKGSLIDLNRAMATAATNNVRVMLAVFSGGGITWFFKFDGDPETVSSQKPAFIEFLKSIQIRAGTAPAEAGPAPVAETAQKLNWTVPAGWKAEPAGQMQVARFSVPGKAEVFVSVFPSDTGGALMNINRWRKQIQLPPATEADLSSLVSPLDPSQSQAILVDMANNNQRLVAAVVPRDGQYWFYKLMGDTSAVAPQKDAFIAFAKSKP